MTVPEGVVRVALLRPLPRTGLLIEAVDRGPGIADVVEAMRAGSSLGLGLPGVKRL